MATSSWQSMPSILKVDSACSSQTVQLAIVIQPARFLDVRERLFQQLEDVVIVDRVVHLAPGAAGPDQAHPAQQAQLMRHCRLADPDMLGDVAHAELPAREGVEDADPGRVAEHAKRLGQGLDRPRREKGCLEFRDLNI